jgi:type II secretory pathway pseudopilin PulG
MTRSNSKAFSLVEAMVAIAIAGLIAATVTAAFQGALVEQADARHEWAGFTIAQQRMELLASMPRGAADLDANSTHPEPGSAADATCDDVPMGPRRYLVDAAGLASPTGDYEVCWKVNANHPIGNVNNIRVIATWPTRSGRGHVLMQTVR